MNIDIYCEDWQIESHYSGPDEKPDELKQTILDYFAATDACRVSEAYALRKKIFELLRI